MKLKPVFNKGQVKRKERYTLIKKTYDELIEAGSDKTAAVNEVKKIHNPISITTIYRALKSK